MKWFTIPLLGVLGFLPAPAEAHGPGGHPPRGGGPRHHARFHDDLEHRRFHRYLDHREAHRYPMTWRQHERLHDSLEHEAFHDRLEHREYHRRFDYRHRGGFYPGYRNPRSGFGFQGRNFSLWFGR